jgi:transposase
LTYYRWHRYRGRRAIEAIGLLPPYEGTAVHDGWGIYQGYACRHGLCNGHHLRELTFIEERYGQAWAGQMKGLLLEMKASVEDAKAREAVVLAASVLATFRRRYGEILSEGLLENPPPVGRAAPDGRRGRLKQTKAKNLVDRLVKYEDQVLRFALDFEVPFDNNQAERDLRMMKLKQKISGGFRSAAGADYFCRLRSYVSTMRKQGQPMLEALEAVFLGEPVIPSLQAE